MRERADVKFAAHSLIVADLFKHPIYPLTPLGEVTSRLQYGISSLASPLPNGYPMIRMSNLQNEGWDFSELKYAELTDKEAQTYKLAPGDILFNRTNSEELVGKCEV